ncbi:MAG: helix-turn-helix domain-containing protein [Candidatus Binatia bacterium]
MRSNAPDSLRRVTPSTSPTCASTPPRRPDAPAGIRTLADLEREAIVQALRLVDGNRRLAADRLGIGLRTLYDKLKRYGLE